MRNIVHISTYKRTGSGVLLECALDSAHGIEKDEKSYLILTNYHVVQDIGQGAENQKKHIRLKIRDIDGGLIDEKYISYVSVQSGNNYDMSTDIAAILVVIKSCCKIACPNEIYLGTEGGRTVATQGYPHVFQDNLVDQELCLAGKLEKYSKQGLGIYKILDDYHGYSDISDKELMEGISGAPVYTEEDGREYLIGINQSLCNTGDGKNPFKILYFVGIGRALEWLRSQGIILFEYKNRHVKILWTGRTDREGTAGKKGAWEKDDGMDTKRIVLIGGSGAGKSSFLETMCQNGKLFGAVGDGQTTRATVVYHLKMNCSEPSISIQFFGADRFADERTDDCELRLRELFLCGHYGMDKKDIEADPLVYLQDIAVPLRYMAEREEGCMPGQGKGCREVLDMISDTIHICRETDDAVDYKDRILKAYDDVLDFLPAFWEKGESGEDRREKYISRGYFSKRAAERYIRENKGKGSVLEFYHDFFDDGIAMDAAKDPESFCPKESLKDIITKKQGFFDIAEFYHLDPEGKLADGCEGLFEKHFGGYEIFSGGCSASEQEEEEDGETAGKDEETAGRDNRSLKKRIRDYYREFYEKVEGLLREKGIEKGIKCDIRCASGDERKCIARCLRKVGDDSLSAIVRKVEIEDAVSNDYAYRLHERRLRGLDIYDTCGIDHIERGNREIYIRSVLDEIGDGRKEKKEEEQKGKTVDAIIYVKKLDSEKPTELQTMLPVINGIEPSCPVFCLFTAADQFLHGREHLAGQLVWDREHYENWKKDKEYREFWFPKVIENIHESELFSDRLDVPDEVREKNTNFILDHMFPFACRYDINQDRIIELNRRSIVSIVRSILVDEWNIGFIPAIKKDAAGAGPGAAEENGDPAGEELKAAVREDLVKMFSRASRCDWSCRHHSTVRANFRRIYRYSETYNDRHKELGFNRTLVNRWDNLLQQGFSESFLSQKGKTLRVLEKKYGLSVEKAHALLAAVKNETITAEMGIWKVEKDRKPEFRELFKKMYENKEIYPVNVFEEQEWEKKYGGNAERIKFLNMHCDFARGLEGNEEIKTEFAEYFCGVIHDKLEENNARYFDALLKYNVKFRESLEYVERVVRKYTDRKPGKDENVTGAEVWGIITENYKGSTD